MGGGNRKERFDLRNNLWDYRIRKLLDYVDLASISSLMDLGAGGQHVKQYLPDTVRYIPVDYKQREYCMETIICDFNAGEFPTCQADVVYCSGILEYIEKPEEWIRKICSCCGSVVLAYNVVATETIAEREGNGWICHLTDEELVGMFAKCNFICVAHDRYDSYKETFYKFVKAS